MLITRAAHTVFRAGHWQAALTLFLGAAAVLLTLTQARAAPEAPEGAPLKVCSAIVYDLNDDVILFEQNVDERIPPASLTKIMSMHLALDHVGAGNASLQEPVEVSGQAAAATGSRMGLRANERVSLKKLLLGMAVSSGNDASHAVAEHVAGSVPAFVRMMNVKAQSLGMTNSRFATPHGLPAPDQYTTARDMLCLARSYLRRYPDSLSEYHNLRVLSHNGRETINRNPLLGQFPGADGLKTGWIRASGYNLIFTAKRGGKRLLAVIMGAPDVNTRGIEACRLLEAGFRASGNQAVSVAAALEAMPESPYPLALRQPSSRTRPFADKYLARRKQFYSARKAGARGPGKYAGRRAVRKAQAGPGLRKANAKNVKKIQAPRRHADTRSRKKSAES